MKLTVFNKADLLRRLPEFLHVYEMRQIAEAENTELDVAKAGAEKVLSDGFVQTCGEDAIGYFEDLYEKIYGGALDRSGWNLEKRRQYCMWAVQLRRCPITESFFREFVDWLFKDPLEERFQAWLEIDYENYLVALNTLLYFDDEKIFNAWVNNYFRAVIPANMVFRLHNHRTHEMLKSRYTHADLSAYTHYQISNN
ncbi:MAG: hypothetical protein J1F63_00455 [Oscillospiraceae bacterium]|nr:hypothetical protein [Oscillospiraceae bacterium]